MNSRTRILISAAVGIVLACGAMARDKMTHAEWEVSPEQIAQANQHGQAGYETSPGTVAVLPIRSETADILPFKWLFFGICGAGVAYVFTGRNRRT